jgi:hypothetical protein
MIPYFIEGDEQQKQDGDGACVGLPRIHCDHFSNKRLVLYHRLVGDAQTRFRALLGEVLKPEGIKEDVMNIVITHFASSATLANTAAQAVALYRQACLLPRSATKLALQNADISVGGVFKGGDPSASVLMYAHKNGTPHILKISTASNIAHEINVWNTVRTAIGLTTSHLVPLEEVAFDGVNTNIEIGDFDGTSSIPYSRIRSGLLMKHFQGTLSQCTIPLTKEVLLRYGAQLFEAIYSLHKAGYCHLDIKPPNIFLFEGDCFLGDYGAAVKTGEPIKEYTVQYYPADGDCFHAKEETDMLLLAVTLLEMFGSIRPPPKRSGGLTVHEIKEAINDVKCVDVRGFLLSLFD